MNSCNSWDGTESSIQVKFEPEALGEIRDTLTLTSGGSEYKCSLHGIATPPLPQGPFIFTQTQEIVFKNVFNEAHEFLFTSDNPHFVVTPRSQTVPAKGSKNVTIKRGDTDAMSITGKVLVTCLPLPDMPPWVFYLESNMK